jgi:type III restriction enzyme
MRFKEFQQRVLDRLGRYLGALAEQSAKAAKIAAVAAERPELGLQVPDFTAAAWEAMKAAGELPAARAGVPFSPRRDGIGRSVPNVCLKVPTGGGKTLLAAAAVSRIQEKWIHANHGFVLWVVPNESIYAQTLRHLRDREHSYRHMLDQAAGGRVRILEKDDPLHRADVDSNLCVMLLMLQSANRETKETLRLFRDRGSVHGFFPAADDKAAHETLLAAIPNLDAYSDVTIGWHVVKDSLGNVLRRIRPVVVLDEGHKGYSKLALGTVYGFNPAFVLELSATPVDRPRDGLHSNWLVDVRGVDLDAEGMIKLPINLRVLPGTDWRRGLRAAVDKLRELQEEAERLRADTARYIRPICLIQVERTGEDQRDARHVHAEDAREYLLTLGAHESEIAIKTADRNDLKAPENQDLLADTNPIRFIVTKQALQEGWDCPFAYVLCALAPSSSKSAMTQLIGRILRQPDTVPTGVAPLDECHVVCVHAKTKEVLEAIKAGLERDGMGDLVERVVETNGSGRGDGSRKVPRRPEFSKLKVFLPKVLWVVGTPRELDYEADILSQIDYAAIDLGTLPKRLAALKADATEQTIRIGLTGTDALIEAVHLGPQRKSVSFDRVYATRAISDLVPNAWTAYSIIDRLLGALKAAGMDDWHLGAASSVVIDHLRSHLGDEIDRMAETLFRAELTTGRIQFRLRADGRNYSVPQDIESWLPANAPQFVREDGMPSAKSLFAPVYRDDLNGYEQAVAGYVDEQAAVRWWHRNVARVQYGVQGWRRHRVFPDFVIALTRADGSERLLVLEAKGDHLDNGDSTYKQRLLRAVTEAFAIERGSGGKVELEFPGGIDVVCELVFQDQWGTGIPELIAGEKKVARR